MNVIGDDYVVLHWSKRKVEIQGYYGGIMRCGGNDALVEEMLSEKMTLRQIARVYGVTPSSARVYCMQRGINRKPKNTENMKIIGDGGHAAVIRTLANRTGTVIAVGDNRDRKGEAEAHAGDTFPILVHPCASINGEVLIGEGTVIMAGAVVQTRAKIGRFCILNTGCSVDHDCVLGDYVHIAPGAHLCGNVTVGEGALVGVGVGVAPNTVIPAWSLVKAARLDICPMK